MLTVHELSEMAGVSVRTLHHYDAIGLLSPAARTEAGYRLYGGEDVARLREIMLLRELEFPLADIAAIIDSPGYDRVRALRQQVELLKLKREHIDRLIDLAQELMEKGETTMGFEAFDTSKLDEYKRRAKEEWGTTSAWQEYERRSDGRTREDERNMGNELMELFVPFGQMAAKEADPASDDARAQAQLIQAFITEHFYTCTDEIFAGLGHMYGSGGEFTQNINAVAGPGAAEFASRAVEAYLASKGTER